MAVKTQLEQFSLQGRSVMLENDNPLHFLLQNNTNIFPRNLVEKFPHVARKIAALWNHDDAISDYFLELMVPRRQGRQGFPNEVGVEIMTLSLARERIGRIDSGIDTATDEESASRDVWANIEPDQRAKDEVLKLTIPNFIKALESDDHSLCLFFLNSGFNVNLRDANHWTPLMIAAFNGSEKVAILLVNHGADINATDRDGYAPIHWAAYNGYQNVISLLLRKGVRPNVTSNAGMTPLLQASAMGHVEAVAVLLRNGADPNLTTNDGVGPLLKAVANVHLKVIDMLVLAGASKEAVMKNGYSVRDAAKRTKDPIVFEKMSLRLSL